MNTSRDGEPTALVQLEKDQVVIRSMKGCPCKKRLKRPGLFSLGKRCLRGDRGVEKVNRDVLLTFSWDKNKGFHQETSRQPVYKEHEDVLCHPICH